MTVFLKKIWWRIRHLASLLWVDETQVDMFLTLLLVKNIRYRKNKLFLEEEFKFYKKMIGKNCNFILSKNKTSYEILLNYKYIFSTYSTLSLEFFAKGGRTGFIMFKSKNNPIIRYRFGDFENLKNKGAFWTSFLNLDKREIKRVFDFVTKSSNATWKKQIKKH